MRLGCPFPVRWGHAHHPKGSSTKARLQGGARAAQATWPMWHVTLVSGMGRGPSRGLEKPSP